MDIGTWASIIAIVLAFVCVVGFIACAPWRW